MPFPRELVPSEAQKVADYNSYNGYYNWNSASNYETESKRMNWLDYTKENWSSKTKRNEGERLKQVAQNLEILMVNSILQKKQ